MTKISHHVKGSRCPPPVTDTLRLYTNRFCPYSERVHLILDAKQIPYETVYINLNSIPDWYSKKVLTGKVPAIELPTGEVIFESTIIAQYLDEKYPIKVNLLPKDISEKCKDLMLIEYFNDVISALNAFIRSMGIACSREAEVIKKGLDTLEKELECRGSFYGGKQPTLVDYFLWPWVERSDLIKLFRTRVEFRKENFQHIMEWHKNMMANEAVKKNFLDIETHTKFLQTYCSGVPQYDLF